jgi:Plasmid pRiA4b ORF-3-like protein
MKAAAFPEEVLQLRIQIREIEPPIFRVIQVTNTRTFHLLHEIIQWSFGWDHAHLYEFKVGRTKIAEPDAEFDEPPFPRHPRATRIGDLVSKDVARFTYVYDLGDEWIHDIAVERRFAPDPAVRYPICLDGARAAPPEDCGSTPGYGHFLEAWRDPKHEEHEQMRRWAGPRYDPERFDLKVVNEVLKTLRAQASKSGRLR